MSFKLIGATLLFVALTTLANGLYLITSEKKVLLEQMDAQGESLARATSIFAIEPLLIRDYPVLETFVENIIKGKHGVRQVRILRADGKIAARAFVADLNNSTTQEFKTYTSEIRVSTEDVNHIGLVEIDIATSRFDSLISQRIWTLGLVSFFAFFTLGLMISLLIRRTVAKPLHSLANKATALGRGDLETIITLPTRDELGVLANTLDSMRQDLKKSYSEIDQQNQELKELDRMKDDFLARISHEFNTPLNGILGLLSALKHKTIEPLPKSSIESLDTIESSAIRLKTLADKLLSFRPASKKEEPESTDSVELDCLLEELFEQHKSEIRRKGLYSNSQIEQDLRVQANVAPLKRIFNNLLANAVKFTHNGSILLTAESINGAGVAISIIDTGIGIPEDLQPQIFERFQQSGSYKTRNYEGAGIGLAVVKQDVGALNGTIKLQSEPNKGSCFTVLLPINDTITSDELASAWERHQPQSNQFNNTHAIGAEATLTFATEGQSNPQPTNKPSDVVTISQETDPHKKTILIVEDNKTNRLVLNLHLQSAYNVIEVENGKQCINKLTDRNIDLILLDLMMPGISGFDVLEYINVHPDKAYPRVIVVSALMDTKSISHALQLGAVDYITKPFNADELLARVRNHMALVDREFHLEQQVHERTAQLEKANQLQADTFQQLVQSEKMSSLGLLTAGVAHEINNPISFIHSNLGTLRKYSHIFQQLFLIYGELEQAVNSKNKEKTSQILKKLPQERNDANLQFILDDIPSLLSDTIEGTERVTSIVRGMKGFAHSDKGMMAMGDINKGLKDTLNVIWNELKYKCKLHKSFGDIPQTYCNLDQLNQVFANLLINAAQAIESNGDIEISSDLVNNNIVVRIADSGQGINKENIQHLFDPFFTTKSVGQGTGLGLYVSYEIIQQHKGTIDVQSETGEGTTVTVTLPVTKEDKVSGI